MGDIFDFMIDFGEREIGFSPAYRSHAVSLSLLETFVIFFFSFVTRNALLSVYDFRGVTFFRVLMVHPGFRTGGIAAEQNVANYRTHTCRAM